MNDYKILKLFENTSVLFQAFYQEPLWNKYGDHLENSIDAARIFLEGYAFEHQGRSIAFPHAAIEIIKKLEKTQNEDDFQLTVWNDFSNLLENRRLNCRINPLYHRCWKNCRLHATNSCDCIWCILNSENIVAISIQDLKKGQTKNAFERLRKIRGVGSKISSLFLRDITIKYNLANSIPVEDRWLLQPIDIWVQRIVQSLNIPKEKDSKKIAEWIVDCCNEHNIDPEQCNQGMWYFAARIAGSKIRLDKSLQDMAYAETLLKEHITALKATVLVATELESKLRLR